jgi:hypothetical protein
VSLAGFDNVRSAWQDPGGGPAMRVWVKSARNGLLHSKQSTHKSAGAGRSRRKWERVLPRSVAILLVILSLLGMVSSYTIGGFIHVLLVVAIVVVLMRVIRGRNAI